MAQSEFCHGRLSHLSYFHPPKSPGGECLGTKQEATLSAIGEGSLRGPSFAAARLKRGNLPPIVGPRPPPQLPGSPDTLLH